MKAISIKQPWAWMIFHGKPVENRSWPSPYRGPLLIHASLSYDISGAAWLREQGIKIPERTREGYPFGAIIGQVNMVDCVTSHPSPFFFGPYGHVYADPAMFKKPIPYKGQRLIFDVPQEKLIHDGKCPACGELLVYPRGDSAYCEECLWPDEILPPDDAAPAREG